MANHCPGQQRTAIPIAIAIADDLPLGMASLALWVLRDGNWGLGNGNWELGTLGTLGT